MAPGQGRLVDFSELQAAVARCGDEGPNAGTAHYLVRELGAVAAWILEPEWLETALSSPDLSAERRKRLLENTPRGSGRRGGTTLVFELLPNSDGAGWLAPAFCLPVVWREAPPLGHVPEGVRVEAQRVAGLLGAEGTWLLDLDTELVGRVDLSQLKVGAESAGVSLAAALIQARDGGTPDPSVWASAALQEHGDEAKVAGVSGLRDKLQAASRRGARTFFVAATDQAKAHRDAPAGVAVTALPCEAGDLENILRDLLLELEVPPGEELPLAQRVAYHGRVLKRGGGARASNYYEENLLDDLVTGCREQSKGDLRIQADPVDHLLSFVSKKPLGALLVQKVLRPRRTLFFHSSDTRETAERYRALLGQGVTLHGLSSNREAWEEEVFEAAADFLEGSPGRVGLDITPGPKDLSFIMAAAAKQASRFYLEHEWEHGEPKPGTERLRVVRSA